MLTQDQCLPFFTSVKIEGGFSALQIKIHEVSRHFLSLQISTSSTVKYSCMCLLFASTLRSLAPRSGQLRKMCCSLCPIIQCDSFQLSIEWLPYYFWNLRCEKFWVEMWWLVSSLQVGPYRKFICCLCTASSGCLSWPMNCFSTELSETISEAA